MARSFEVFDPLVDDPKRFLRTSWAASSGSPAVAVHAVEVEFVKNHRYSCVDFLALHFPDGRVVGIGLGAIGALQLCFDLEEALERPSVVGLVMGGELVFSRGKALKLLVFRA